MIGEMSAFFAVGGNMVFNYFRYNLKAEGALQRLKGPERCGIGKCFSPKDSHRLVKKDLR